MPLQGRPTVQRMRLTGTVLDMWGDDRVVGNMEVWGEDTGVEVGVVG